MDCMEYYPSCPEQFAVSQVPNLCCPVPIGLTEQLLAGWCPIAAVSLESCPVAVVLLELCPVAVASY